jgi:hypothetical protein
MVLSGGVDAVRNKRRKHLHSPRDAPLTRASQARSGFGHQAMPRVCRRVRLGSASGLSCVLRKTERKRRDSRGVPSRNLCSRKSSGGSGSPARGITRQSRYPAGPKAHSSLSSPNACTATSALGRAHACMHSHTHACIDCTCPRPAPKRTRLAVGRGGKGVREVRGGGRGRP